MRCRRDEWQGFMGWRRDESLGAVNVGWKRDERLGVRIWGGGRMKGWVFQQKWGGRGMEVRASKCWYEGGIQRDAAVGSC